MIIATKKDLLNGIAALCDLEPRFRLVAEALDEVPLRVEPAGLGTLLNIITEQSISLDAARAVWKRLEAAFDPGNAEAVLQVPLERLRSLGLTRSKGRAFHAAADADSRGVLGTLSDLDDDSVRRRLTALHGIGPWTAETYLLSCLARSDAWPAGDVALQSAAGSLFAISPRPSARQMITLGEPWRPWRAVAARLLWTWYRQMD